MNSRQLSTNGRRTEQGQVRLGTLAALSAMVIALLLGAGMLRDAQADPASPLLVTKTANPSPVASGAQLTYTITMTNTGGAKLNNLVMTDQVNGVGVIQNPPALPQLQMTSSQGACTQGGPNGNVVTCNGGTLNGGATWTVTIRGQVTASNGTTLNNTASVTGTKSAQTFSTSATAQTLVSGGTGGGPQPDLTINKTGPSSVATLSPLTYTLTVNNVGTAHATNVKVVDTLPPGVALVSVNSTSLFVCTPSGGPVPAPITVTCVGGAVNFGQNATITINGTSPAAAGQITNTAVVDPDNTIAESNELNNTSATVYTNVGLPPSGALLDIKKTDGVPFQGTWGNGAGPDPVTPGQQITYKIQVTNNATGTNARADDVIVTDGTQGLEASSIVVSQVVVNGTVGTFGGCVVTAPQVRCQIRSLNKGGTLTITITGTVISSAGASIFNTATVTGNVKNTGVTNTASEVTTVKPAIDLTITKADNPDPVCARSWPIDAGFYGADQHLALDPAAPVPGASGTPTELLAPAVCLGGLTYSFVVGNSGIQTATGVVVRDPLPAGLIFDSYENDPLFDAGFTCVDVANVITCSGGTIPPESITKLAFRLVAPPSLGTITNTVYVDPNNAIFEPDEQNNTFVQSTNIATGVDLVVWKSDSVNVNPPGDDAEGAPTLIPGDGVDPGSGLGDGFDPIATSGTQTVTIYVDNIGTQDVTNIRVRDTLPAGTRFLSVMEVAGGSDLGPGPGTLHGFTCSHNGAATGGVVECVGGNLLGTESEFYEEAGAPAPPPPGDHFATIKIRFFARPEVGTMHNEVRVDPLNEIVEVNELNNLATDETIVGVGDFDKGAYHQLGVVKTQASPNADLPFDPVATNGTLIYNLDVTNYGTDPISNIILVDALPTGTRFIEAKDTEVGTESFFCSHDGAALGGVITCIGGDLDGSLNTIPGVGETTRRVTVKVFAPDTPGTYNNLATVDPNNLVPEGNEFDNDAQLSTLVAPCVGQTDCTKMNAFYELTIAKAQSSPAPPIIVATNGVITYDLLVTNLGSDPVYGVAVKDTLPAGSRFIDAQDTGGALDPASFHCGEPDATNTLTCVGGTLDGTLDTLGAGVPQLRTISIRIFAPNTPSIYPNQSKVDPANAVPEGNEFNNTSNMTTAVAPCDPAGVPDDCTDANAFYELTIEKTQNRPTIARNGLETYTLKVENFGSDPVFDIVVQDALPVGSRLLDARDTAPPSDPDAFTCGGLDATGVVTCTGGDLSGTAVSVPGIPTSRQIQIRAFMPDLPEPDGYPNQSVVDPFNAIPEGNEFNNESSLVTIVQNGGPDAYIDLSVDKTQTLPNPADQDDHGHAPAVHPGDLMVFNLHVANGGEGDAFNVSVRDVIPENAPFFSAEDVVTGAGMFTCTFNAPNIDCSGGTIPAGGSRNIRVRFNAPTGIESVDPPPADDIEIRIRNDAFVDSANAIPEGDESNNADEVDAFVRSKINLTLEKNGPDNATQNQKAVYTIRVKNEKVWGDGAIAVDAVVVDTLPVGLIPLNVTANNGSESNMLCSIEENPVNVVTCVGDIEPEAEVIIDVDVFITQESGPMYNQACVDPDHEIDETNELDNCEIKTTVVGGDTPTPEPTVANLNINKSASSSLVSPGQDLTYTVTVANVGTGTAADVTIKDDLSALPVTFVSANATNGFNCVEAAAVVTCTDGGSGLAAGANTVVTIQVTVDADASAAFTNTAMVDDADPFATAVDTASVMTNVGAAGIDLIAASYTDSPDPVPQGDSVTFTAVVTNGGTADTTTDPAPNTVVVQTLFDSNTGLSVASATASQGFACDSDLSDFMIECTGDLAALDGDEWVTYPVIAGDASFFAAQNATLAARASGYDSDRAALDAVGRDATLAIVDATEWGPYDFIWDVEKEDGFEPFTASFRHPVTLEESTVTVVGVLGTRLNAEIIAGLYVNADAYRQVFDEPEYQRTYIQLVGGANVQHSARAIESALASDGVQAEGIKRLIDESAAQDRAFTRMFQGFMALGLVVGIVALGVIAFRSVVERRQQIGMLRAIGYQRGTVALTFVLESGFIALMGILSGVVGGVIVSRNLFTTGQFAGEGVDFMMPWTEVLIFTAAALVVSLVMTWWPSRAAAKVPVADALRYE